MDLLKTYLNIINNKIKIKNTELSDGFDSDSNSYCYNPIIISNILFENVYQKDLDPIPNKIYHYICSKLNITKSSVFHISYKKMYELFSDSDEVYRVPRTNTEIIATSYTLNSEYGLAKSGV